MVTNEQAEWLARKFKCSELVQRGMTVADAERLNTAAIEFAKVIMEVGDTFAIDEALDHVLDARIEATGDGL